MSYSIVQDLRSVKKIKSLWNFKPFDEVIIDVTSGNLKVKKEDYQVTGLFPVVDQGKNLIAGYINEDLTVAKGLDYIVFGDHTRIFKYIDFDFVLGADGVKLLRPRLDKVITKFLYYYFQTLTIPDTGYNRHFKFLKDVIIPLPSIEEQRYIVRVLDKAQALIDKRKQAIAKLDELVQAVFLDMFGDPTINQMGYPIGIIRDLIIEAKYGTSKKANEGTGQFPYLRMNNITYQGYMDYSNLKYIDLDDKEQEKYLVQRGDLLFNRTNSKELVGKTAVFDSDEKMAIAGYIVRVKTNDAGNPYFISGYLNSKHGKKVLQEMCKNIIGMANINAQELQNIAILIPPRELQDSYERKFKAILEEKKKHLTQLQHLESNFQALLQKAFKGELKVKDGVEV